MPQMAPMWWMTLMLIFIFSYILSISYIYFNSDYNLHTSISIKSNNLIWEW